MLRSQSKNPNLPVFAIYGRFTGSLNAPTPLSKKKTPLDSSLSSLPSPVVEEYLNVPSSSLPKTNGRNLNMMMAKNGVFSSNGWMRIVASVCNETRFCKTSITTDVNNQYTYIYIFLYVRVLNNLHCIIQVLVAGQWLLVVYYSSILVLSPSNNPFYQWFQWSSQKMVRKSLFLGTFEVERVARAMARCLEKFGQRGCIWKWMVLGSCVLGEMWSCQNSQLITIWSEVYLHYLHGFIFRTKRHMRHSLLFWFLGSYSWSTNQGTMNGFLWRMTGKVRVLPSRRVPNVFKYPPKRLTSFVQ